MNNQIILGDNLTELDKLPDAFATMIYIDPPFATGKTQKRQRIKTTKVKEGEVGDRIGFGGTSYKTTVIENTPTYEDNFEDFPSFLMPRIEKSLKCLTNNGSIFIHLDYREVHYIKIEMDKLLGKKSFINEIIWSYDYGARSKTKWSCKHDNILWYALNPDNYIFNYDAMERIPYMAPGLVGEEKAAKGKTPTDVFWHTICPTQGKEKTGYPTQKPQGMLERLIKVHTNENDYTLDYFAGSGTTGAAAAKHNRKFVLIDQNPEAIEICKNRLKDYLPIIPNS